ncbi:MAG TPA: hypothetical protein VIJ34_06570 [Acidimicrobiales bacterium]|jgi:hypothetical protein
MDYGDNELSRFLYGSRSAVRSPDYEGLTYDVERRLSWPTIGRALRSVVRKIR